MGNPKLLKTGNKRYNLRSNLFDKDVSISMLNDDCMEHILSFLSFKDRLMLQRVCKRWQALMPWGGVKKLKLGETEILCNSECISKFSLCSLKKVLSLCGFSIINVEIGFFQDKARRTNILKLMKQLCPKMSSLDLSKFELHRQAADFVISNFNNLQAIVIGDCNAGEESISKIFSANQSLRSVKFVCSESLQGSCLFSLPVHFIEKLEFFSSKNFLFTNVKKTLQQMCNLRILHIVGDSSLIENSDELLKALPNESNLYQIYICGSISDKEIVQINSLADFTNLRVLTLGQEVLHDKSLTTIGNNCKKLKVLFLFGSAAVTDVGWKNLAKIPNLQVLGICHLPNLSDESLLCLQVSSLKRLYCHKMDKLTNESLHFILKSAKKLRALEVTHCQLVKMDTLVRVASAEAEKRSKYETIELGLIIDESIHSVLKNISSQLIIRERFVRMFTKVA